MIMKRQSLNSIKQKEYSEWFGSDDDHLEHEKAIAHFDPTNERSEWFGGDIQKGISYRKTKGCSSLLLLLLLLLLGVLMDQKQAIVRQVVSNHSVHVSDSVLWTAYFHSIGQTPDEGTGTKTCDDGGGGSCGSGGGGNRGGDGGDGGGETGESLSAGCATLIKL